jgi:hypothetical protein
MKFKYNIIEADNICQFVLDELGYHGWELVSVIPIEYNKGGFGPEITIKNQKYKLILKKEYE